MFNFDAFAAITERRKVFRDLCAMAGIKVNVVHIASPNLQMATGDAHGIIRSQLADYDVYWNSEPYAKLDPQVAAGDFGHELGHIEFNRVHKRSMNPKKFKPKTSVQECEDVAAYINEMIEGEDLFGASLAKRLVNQAEGRRFMPFWRIADIYGEELFADAFSIAINSHDGVLRSRKLLPVNTSLPLCPPRWLRQKSGEALLRHLQVA